MKDIASVTIKIVFSEKLKDYTSKLGHQTGKQLTLDQIIGSLVSDYSKVMQKTPSFTNPLKAMDKNVRIEIDGKVFD
jgi:hypothetical protein